MIELRFTGGGPLDGRELAAPGPLGESVAVSGGRYQLWGTLPAEGVSRMPVAYYEWIPSSWGE
jgi:hypothetical protein